MSKDDLVFYAGDSTCEDIYTEDDPPYSRRPMHEHPGIQRVREDCLRMAISGGYGKPDTAVSAAAVFAKYILNGETSEDG